MSDEERGNELIEPHGSRLADRWTDAEKELAYKVSNDIAEDIDCKESRKTLRMCVAIWSDLYCDLHMGKEATASEKMLKKIDGFISENIEDKRLPTKK